MNQGDRQVLLNVFPLIKPDFHLSDTQLDPLGTTFFWVYGALLPIAATGASSFSSVVVREYHRDR